MRGTFFAMLANITGGSAYPATALALTGFSAPGVVFWRTLISFMLFLPFFWRRPRPPGAAPWAPEALIRPWPKLTGGEWLRVAAVGFFGYAAPLLIGTVGIKLSSATNGSLLLCVEPVAIVLLSVLFLNEKINGFKTAAIVSGITGTAIIVLQGIPFINVKITPHFAGDILLALHGFFWALYTIIGKPVLRKVEPLVFSWLTTFFGLIPLTFAAWPSLGLDWAALGSSKATFGVFYLAVTVSFLSVFLWNKALELIPASQMANFIFLQPLMGVFVGVFLQGESLTIWSSLGGGLILLGVLLATREPKI